jgi:hypothetical protein
MAASVYLSYILFNSRLEAGSTKMEPYHLGTEIQRRGPPGWGLYAKLTTVFCKLL